ncbi:diaminopimelate decarboxylase [Rubeoparvulum massiliense]|uniref:diaminopimelate decarboxylase n=1 Tax=Rubeoparvulum massiliense TaxID=1631346 RepID=UPI00065E5526|nr:diaminopimelate decarboxylase [Rubeoparvulum massiliense]
MVLHGTSSVNAAGHLEIGGVDTVELAKQFGTPLYVYDVALIQQRAQQFLQVFAEEGLQAQVAYASKAFSSIAIIQLVDQLGLSLDVVSGGELYTAIQAGFPPERIHFHGNNKSPAEMEYAIQAGVGCFVADNFYEIAWLKRLSEQYKQSINLLLRITPGVEAHTHEYISTGQEDSKFGFDLVSGQATAAIEQVLQSSNLQLLGVHSHIGSQIFDPAGFIQAIQKIYLHLEQWEGQFGRRFPVLNVGGGFGIRYVEGDRPIPVEQHVHAIIITIREETTKRGWPMPEIWIEPGRSLVGDAGTTLYTIGSMKHVPGMHRYVAVDGGMTDNIRPALYHAQYEGVLANRMRDRAEQAFAIAGKCCETGDMLIWDLPLPQPEHGDLLAVFCTGAYGYAMASNYNRLPRPAIVFVENSEAQLVVERESYADLIRHDRPYSSSKKNPIHQP